MLRGCCSWVILSAWGIACLFVICMGIIASGGFLLVLWGGGELLLHVWLRVLGLLPTIRVILVILALGWLIVAAVIAWAIGR